MTARSKNVLVQAVLLGACLVSRRLEAGTWNNSGTDFNATTSWDSAPAGKLLVFASAATKKQPMLSDNIIASALQFSSGGYQIGATSPYVLTLTTVSTASTPKNAIDALNTTGTNTIDAPLVLGAAAGQTQVFYQAAKGALVVKGAISSSTNVVLNTSGGGAITLAGASTYAGGTKLDAGATLNINNGGTDTTNSAIGTGVLNWASGPTAATRTIDNTSGSPVTLRTNNTVTINSTGTFSFTGSNDLDFGSGAAMFGVSGDLKNNSGSGKSLTFGSLVNNRGSGALGLNVIGAPDAPVVFRGCTLNYRNASVVTNSISGSGTVKITGPVIDGMVAGNSLTYKGTGRLLLGGDNTYTGGTNVQSGVLQLDGKTAGQDNWSVMTSSESLAAPSLIGIGTVGLASGRSITVTGNIGFSGSLLRATVNPGDINTTCGTLTIGTDSTNITQFDENSVLAIDINGDLTDKLVVTGNLLLRTTTDTLLVNTSGQQTLSRYVLATYAGTRDGEFYNVIYNGGNLPGNLYIDYSVDHQIALATVPEPVGMSLLLGMVGTGLAMRRRTRA